MRVLLVSSLYPPVLGGAEVQAQNLARQLDALGVRVSVLTRPHQGAEVYERDCGIQVHRRLRALPVGPLWGVTYMLSTRKWLHRLQSEWDVIHNQQVALHSWVSVRAARALNRPCLLRFASLGAGGDLATLSRHRFGQRLVSELRGAGRFVALTGAGAEEVQRHGMPAERVRTIPNGVDLQRFAPQPWPQLQGGEAVRLLYVGRLSREKGLDVLLEALRLIKERARFQVRIVGAGAELESLRAHSRAAALDADVEFCGPQRDVLAHYAWSEVVVLPSHFEGMPNVVLEAMACARPVLGTRVNGTADLVTPESGWLVPSDDPAALARQLGEIVAQRTALAAFGLAGRRVSETTYSMAQVASRYLYEYETMLAEHAAAS